jgi:hypothetical protein
MSKYRLVVALISIICVVIFSIYLYLFRLKSDFSEDVQSKNFIVDKNFYDFINSSIENQSSVSSENFEIIILDSVLNLDICSNDFFTKIKSDLAKTDIAKSILINPYCLKGGGVEIWFNFKAAEEYDVIRSEIFNVLNNLTAIENLKMGTNFNFFILGTQKNNMPNLNIRETQQAFYINDLFYEYYQFNKSKIYKNRYSKVLNIPPRNLLLNSLNSKICDVNFSTLKNDTPTVTILSLSGSDKLKNCSADIEDSINTVLDANLKIKLVPYEFIESTKYLTSRVVVILASAGFFLLSVVYFFIRLFRKSYFK